MDDDTDASEPTRLARLLSNPLWLRRAARTLIVVIALGSGVAWATLDGAGQSLVLAFGWIALPFIALALGIGEGFFIEHGRRLRRNIATLLFSVVLALGSCVALAVVPDGGQSTGRGIVSGSTYALFYAAIALGLGAACAIAFGRGGAYLGRRIQEVDDEGW